MAGARHKLNRTIVKGLAEPGRYNDGGGLYLMIRKSGLKTWVFRYIAISTGRRNTLAKPLGRCFILEGHSRTLVKLSCYCI